MTGAAPETKADTWSDTGYVTQTPYMRDFFRYQTPVSMSWAAAINGFAAPDPTAPFRYVDLGCGEAVTLLVLAAAYPNATFLGVDLNPEHIAHAQAMADVAGLDNLRFLVTTFDDPSIAAHGPFDYVASHGVYSWVSHDVQAQIRAAVGRLLRPGGLFYMCHYVRPGSAKIELLFALLQSLMKRNPEADLEARAKTALRQARALIASGAPMFQRYTSLNHELTALENRDPRYLVHEFCNQHFTPAFLGTVFDAFAALDVHPVGSTREERNDRRNLFTTPQDEALQGLDWAEAEVRASLMAFDVFRWDLFAKAAPGQPPARADTLGRFHFDARAYPYRFARSYTLWEREVPFDTPLMRRLIDLVARGQRDCAAILAASGAPRGAVIEGLRDMVAARAFQPLLAQAVRPYAPQGAVFALAHPLSGAFCARDLMREGQVSFPSGVLGGALTLAGFDALATWALDGKTVEGGAADLSRRIAVASEAEVAALGLQKARDRAGFVAAWRRFVRAALPRLLKYDVLRAKVP